MALEQRQPQLLHEVDRATLVRRWPCWLEVDLDAVAANVAAIGRWVSPRVRLLAVVKAQAYGLGAVEVARAALAAGAWGLAVARVGEGVQLRQAGIGAPILVLGWIAPELAPVVVQHHLRPTVANLPQAEACAEAARAQGRRLPVHVKVDTGLHRYGVALHEAVPFLRALGQFPTLDVEGLYTHFACADDADPTVTREQLQRFHAVRQALAREGLTFSLLHAANSAGTLGFPDAHLDAVRPGLAILGYRPSPHVPEAVPLRPAVSLRARVVRLMDLAPGATVGYGGSFRAERPMRVALVTLGYADGLPRCLSNHGELLVRGRRVRLVGRVSMDQCVVDVTSLPNVEVGDEVVAFGNQGDETISLDEFAARSDTISHEALTRIGPRVPRLYLRRGAPVAVRSLSGDADPDEESPSL